MATFPAVIVEIGFSAGADTGTSLTFDDVARGLFDTGTFAADVLWTDVTAYVLGFSTNRGSSRTQGPALQYDAGTASITLDNSDRRFDPTNLSGPYVSGGATQVTPMRAMRIRATWAGSTYDIWRGTADSWQIDYRPPNYSSVVVSGTDAFKVLAAYDRAAGGSVGAGETSGVRVGRILDSVVWSASDRIVDVGETTLQATTLDGNALSELQLVADTEIGELYIDGAGRVVFRGRHGIAEDARSNTSQATFGDGAGELPYADVTPDYDDTSLANYALITRVGGTEQTASDTTSRTTYLTHTYTRSDLIMQTDTEALSYAGYIVYVGKDPEFRFSELLVKPLRDSTNLFPQVLGREIGDRVTVKRRPPGGGSAISRDVFIRGIAHTVTPDTWQTQYQLQSATRYSFLVLDSANLGTFDSNALGY